MIYIRKNLNVIIYNVYNKKNIYKYIIPNWNILYEIKNISIESESMRFNLKLYQLLIFLWFYFFYYFCIEKSWWICIKRNTFCISKKRRITETNHKIMSAIITMADKINFMFFFVCIILPYIFFCSMKQSNIGFHLLTCLLRS